MKSAVQVFEDRLIPLIDILAEMNRAVVVDESGPVEKEHGQRLIEVYCLGLCRFYELLDLFDIPVSRIIQQNLRKLERILDSYAARAEGPL